VCIFSVSTVAYIICIYIFNLSEHFGRSNSRGPTVLGLYRKRADLLRCGGTKLDVLTAFPLMTLAYIHLAPQPFPPIYISPDPCARIINILYILYTYISRWGPCGRDTQLGIRRFPCHHP